MKKHVATWTPEICKPSEPDQGGERVAAAYEGEVAIRIPTYDERIFLYEGIEDAGDDKALANKRTVAAVVRKAGQFVEKISIKRLSDGFVFDCYDELMVDTDMTSVVTEIYMKLVGKYSAGNGHAPS
jgi:hypothetical protein